VQARIDLAKKYGLKGVSFWRLGGEGELLKGLVI
jgi:spore germination protein YaaH